MFMSLESPRTSGAFHLRKWLYLYYRVKERKMKPEIKDSVITWVSVTSFVVGVTLTFLGLFLPPTGVIDNSVLVAVGQFLTLAAAGLGVKEYVDGRIIRERMRGAREGAGNE